MALTRPDSTTGGRATGFPDATLLDQVLPCYDYGGRARVVIHAPPAAIFRALRTVTLAEMPLAYALGTIRYLPGLLSGRLKRRPDEASRPFFEIAGSLVLAEEPDREIVIGCIGKLHDLRDQQFVPLDGPEAFGAFDLPDYEKFVQSFRIAGADRHGDCLIVAEHRTRVLGAHGRWKFALYWWLMVGWAGDLLLRMMLHAVKRRAEREARGMHGTAGLAGTWTDARPQWTGRQDAGKGMRRWRRGAIVGIKMVHSAIFLLNSAAILHIFMAGIWNRPSRWTRAALVIALAEVAVFVANRRRCPLTDLVEHLGEENGRVSDIFLPRWFADRIPQLCGPPLLIGVLALSWHRCLAARRSGIGFERDGPCQSTREGRDNRHFSAERAAPRMRWIRLLVRT
jgi:hypothetical protein